MVYNNSANINVTGIVTLSSAGVPTGSTVTQHGVVTAGANNTVTSVAPSTSGNVLTSNGTDWTSAASAGGGNVTGPGSSTDRAIATYNGTGGTALFNNSTTSISSTGAFNNTGQPAFSVNLATSINNVTGDGTEAVLVFDTVNIDQGSAYNTSTGVYTIPVSGIYQLNASICFIGTSVANTFAVGYFKTSTTPARTQGFDVNPTTLVDAGNFALSMSTLRFFAASTQIQVTAIVSGSSKGSGFRGSAAAGGTIIFCEFSGFMVC